MQFITFTVRLILEIYRRNDSKISNKTETGLPFYLAPSQQSKNPGKLKNAKKNADPCIMISVLLWLPTLILIQTQDKTVPGNWVHFREKWVHKEQSKTGED